MEFLPMVSSDSATIADVQAFWDANPLFVGESVHPVGTKAFFEEHKRLYRNDVFAGKIDNWRFPPFPDCKILDVGCGIGFWLVELWERGYRDISGVDLSPNSIGLAQERRRLFGVEASLSVGNAERLDFADASFDHVNCYGVIHHTVTPKNAVREIHRVLKPGGTASIAVYYRNLPLRHWALFQKLLQPFSIGLRGRGREDMNRMADADEVVRLYDGSANPIGRAYTRAQFTELLSPLAVEGEYLHFFPARALRLTPSGIVHRTADTVIPFMIGMFVRKAA
jgi:SAM-dependent methyltransferase